ncbi:hypothetical protein ASF30_12780 [Leifsonia sp. Leaf264]|nr:hypothetical protein ASF30_12780 [Leifsonia sp. Leaf264]
MSHFLNAGVSQVDAAILIRDIQQEFDIKLATVELRFGEAVVASWITDERYQRYDIDTVNVDDEAAAFLSERLGFPAGDSRGWGSDTIRNHYTGDKTIFGY